MKEIEREISGEHFIEKNGKYYIRFSIGDSCD